MPATDISGQHDLNLNAHDPLRKINIPNGMINELILRLAGRNQVPLLVLLNLGPLLPQLAGNDDLAPDGVLDPHDTPDDEHGSRPGGSFLDQLGFQDFHLGTGGQGLVKDQVKPDSYVPLGETVPSLEVLLQFVGSLAV